MSTYAIRPFEERDLDSLLATWNTVFADDAERGGLTREVWEWKFRNNPAGKRIWVATHGDQVVAKYASMPHRVWMAGRETVFSEIVDSMVHPDHRGGLKRPGLFVNVAEPMLDTTMGPDKDMVCYGWPIPSAWRIGNRFLKYELVRTQSLLGREVHAGDMELPGGVEPIERFDHQAKWLWERCCGPWGASTIRDDTFLNWRFCEHPSRTYRILGVRDDEGILRGYTVVFVGKWLLPNMAILVDWLVPPDEPEVGRALVEGALALARQGGAQALVTILPEWSPWYDLHQRGGFRVYDSDLLLVARPAARKFDIFWLRDNWWITLADSDQV